MAIGARSDSGRHVMATILLTEDDDAVRAFVARALSSDGHTVVETCDGEEGFDALRARAGDFDLVLSDIQMPFMDGIELARLVGQFYPNLPVVLMTGYADQRERAQGVNALDVVSKPFSLADIRNAVSSILNMDFRKAS